MEPPDALAGARRASRLLLLTLLLWARPGAEAEVQVSVPPLVEVMRGEPVTLNCTPSGAQDHYVMKWFLVDRSGARHILTSVELQGSKLQGTVSDSWSRSPPYQLDSQGRLVMTEAQVSDEQDYVCVVKAGAAGTAEATARLRVFAKPEATEVEPNKGTLSVMENLAHKIATCYSRNGNPAPQITWYRNGQRLEVPTKVNPEGYTASRTIREASGLQSLSSVLYLRLHKADRDASFHCAAHYSQPRGRHGRLDSPPFHLTLHYPTENVHFWRASPSTTEGWVREGDTVQLLCRGDGSPNPEYTFFRFQDQQETVLNTNLDGNLTLEGVRRGQSGTYGCKVEDYDAPEDAQLSQTLELHVAYLDPLELSVGEELFLLLGGSADVNCSVQGLPTPALRWTKDSTPMGDSPTLSLSSVTFDSAGTYICEASMSTVPLLSRTQSFKLLVQGLPELRADETQPKAEGSWQEGDEVKLVCFARGYPVPKLSWSRLGGSPAELAPGGQGWVSSSLILKVTSALSRDGVSCEASNPHGNVRHVFHFGAVAPQTAQAGVAVMAVAVSVSLLLLVVAAFYCMRRKGRPGCCRRGEKGAPPPGEPDLSHSGSERPEQRGLLMGGASGGARGGSGGFGDEC
ncbi:basal cell adhesion molecule [Elephas maximus indicus]|uniref:basal cell adhesion molecule n=1 Tax=Elephas maximus indicus TaxID=99487 RepID=UPI0021163D3E|nr:basal cell adhesion molecule [Elephas maximus indicus]